MKRRLNFRLKTCEPRKLRVSASQEHQLRRADIGGGRRRISSTPLTLSGLWSPPPSWPLVVCLLLLLLLLFLQVLLSRRRITTEEKANVVAAVWGEEFIQFLATLAV